MLLNFRPASFHDADLLFRWANDPEVRNASFSQNKIEYSAHWKWFREKLEDENCKIFIFTFDSIPIGQVRFEINQDNTAEVSILIDRNFRGKGFASDMLRIASDFGTNQIKIGTIFAHIKLDNKRSLKVFHKAGYGEKKIILFKNHKCFELKFIINSNFVTLDKE